MRKEAKILYVYDAEIDSAGVLAETLRNALTGWDITVSGAKLTTLLFETRKYNVIHLFMPVAAKASQFIRKLSGKTKLLHTVVSAPRQVEDYNSIAAAERLIVFCDNDRQSIRETVRDVSVDLIPPTVALPDINLLQHSNALREKFQVHDRLMAVALNDVSNKQQFDAFLYVVREYNRRGEFRLVVPRFHTDNETLKWRKELQSQIEQERLHSTTLLDIDVDLHSLIDCTDITLHLRKDRDEHFDYPLSMIEAMLIGKPVLCFNIPPYNEVIKGFRKNWACNNIEDFLRESKDIRHNVANLEQVSTELARYARTTFSMDRVASLYRSIYIAILSKQDARIS